MTGPPTPGAPVGLGDPSSMIPERESRVITFEGIDGQYDHVVTDEEWDAANDYASRAATATSFPGVTSIESYRERLLCALAFRSYCDANLSPDVWAWHRPIPEADVRVTDGWNTDVFLDPLQFTVHDQLVIVGPVSECPLTSVIDPLVLMAETRADSEPLTVAAQVDGDENNATVYGFIGFEEDHATLEEMISESDDIMALVHEWETELEFGDGFPPHMLPLGAVDTV